MNIEYDLLTRENADIHLNSHKIQLTKTMQSKHISISCHVIEDNYAGKHVTLVFQGISPIVDHLNEANVCLVAITGEDIVAYEGNV